MKLTLTNHLLLSDIPSEIEQTLIQRLRFQNPKWLENKKMGRWNKDTPEFLKFYQKAGTGSLILPRGYTRQVILLCRRYQIQYQLDDKRRSLPDVAFNFSGKLKPFQQKAVDLILPKEFGTLSAPTASGKTVMALYMIAKRKQPALIILHTKELAFQWVNRIEEFLGISEDEVGFIGGGKKKKIGEKITVALVQTLYKCADEVSKQIGFLIVDECHRSPSRTFTEAVTAFDSRYMLGLSATPWRRDKLSDLIYWHLGDLHYEVDSPSLIEQGHILQAEVIIRETQFKPFFDPVSEYSKMLSELTSDDKRNMLIASDIEKETHRNQGVLLVLSDRKKHCETLQSILKYKFHINSEVLTGDLGTIQRKAVMEKLNHGEIKVLIATGQLIGEGFDCKDLSTLFIATPIKFSGRVIQYLGRILRPAPGKKDARVFDYVDVHVGPLKWAAVARQKVYWYKGINALLKN